MIVALSGLCVLVYGLQTVLSLVQSVPYPPPPPSKKSVPFLFSGQGLITRTVHFFIVQKNLDLTMRSQSSAKLMPVLGIPQH